MDQCLSCFLFGLTCYKSQNANLAWLLVQCDLLTHATIPDQRLAQYDAHLKQLARQDAVIPKRWVVERSFAWLEKCRRL